MNKAVLIGIATLLSVISRAQTAQQLLGRVRAKLEKVKSYQAAGKLAIDVAFIKAPESDVTVYYKRPDRLKIVRENGISILPKGGFSMNLDRILSGEKYAVVDGGKAGGPNGQHIIKLLPLDETAPIVLSTLYIDPANAVIRRAMVTTRENGSYEMDMDYGKYINWGLPDSMNVVFDTKGYKLPKGITFDYEKGAQAKKPPATGKGKVSIKYTSYEVNKNIPDAIFSK